MTWTIAKQVATHISNMSLLEGIRSCLICLSQSLDGLSDELAVLCAVLVSIEVSVRNTPMH